MSDVAQLHPTTTPKGGNGNAGGGDVRERLVRLETKMGYVATKEDLKDMENTLIKWMMGTIAIALVGLVVATIRSMT